MKVIYESKDKESRLVWFGPDETPCIRVAFQFFMGGEWHDDNEVCAFSVDDGIGLFNILEEYFRSVDPELKG